MQNLSHKEQILLERLSVFAGRFLREAAAAVCAGEGIEQNELGNLLAQLVEKSLIIPEAQDEAVRYWLPEAVKQEARACLATNEAVNIFQQRHAAYYVTLAEQTRRKMFGPGRRAWLDRLEQEHHDLEAALYWLADSGQVEQGLRLAVGLREFWLGGDHLNEGRQWLATFLDHPRTTVPSKVRAQALDDAASLAFWQNDKAATTALSEAALAMRRELDDKHGIAISLIHLGTDKRLFEKDYAAAQALYEESLAILRELGNELSIAYALCNLGNLALDQGDYTTAHLLMRQSLVTFRDHQEIWAINFMLDAFAGLTAHQGQPERALRLAGAGEALREAVGIVHSPVGQAWVDELLKPAFQALDEDQVAAARAAGRAMTLEQAIAYALEDS